MLARVPASLTEAPGLGHVGRVLFSMAMSVSLLASTTSPTTWLTLHSESSNEGGAARESARNCLNAEELKEQIISQLGGRSISENVRVDVLEGEPGGFQIRHEEKVVGERSFSDLPENCEERRRTYAVAIAIAVEHLLEEEAALAETEPLTTLALPKGEGIVETEETEGEAEERARASGAADQATDTGIALRLAAGYGVLGGVLPGPASAVSLSLDWMFAEGFSAGLSVGYAPRSRSELHGAQVNSRLLAGGARACYEPSWGPFSGDLCLGAELGRLRATATDIINPEVAHSWWLASKVGAGVRFPGEGPVGLHLGGGGLLNLLRPGVVVELEGAPDSEDSAPALGYFGSLEAFWVLP